MKPAEGAAVPGIPPGKKGSAGPILESADLGQV